MQMVHLFDDEPRHFRAIINHVRLAGCELVILLTGAEKKCRERLQTSYIPPNSSV